MSQGDSTPDDVGMVVKAGKVSNIEKEVEELGQEIEEDIHRLNEKVYNGNRQPAKYHRALVANLDEDHHYEDQTYVASTGAMIFRYR